MLALTRAGIDCKSLTAHQTFGQATPQNRLKQLPKRITITELPVAVIGCLESRLRGDDSSNHRV
jgi:hypothetical protein